MVRQRKLKRPPLSDLDEWPHFLVVKKPALIHCQAQAQIISLIGGGLSVCLQISRDCCQTRRRHNRPFVYLSSHIRLLATKEVSIPVHGFATAINLIWYAYGHPYPSAYLQCNSDFVCCQSVCWTVARPPGIESVARMADDGATLLLSVARLSACLLPDSATAEPTLSLSAVTYQTYYEKGVDYQCPWVAMVCCMLWTPIPIAVSTVWQWLCPAIIRQRVINKSGV